MGPDQPTLTHQPPPATTLSAPPPPPRRRSFGWIVWLLLLAGAIYGGNYIYNATKLKEGAGGPGGGKSKSADKANRPTPVVAATSRTGDIPLYLRGLGSAAPFNTVTVKSRADGQLLRLHFTEGQTVKAGQLLAEIDPRPYQVALEQARGQLARDTAALKDAQTNLARYKALWEEKVIARQQYDTQASAVGQSEGTIEADNAAISNAQLNLSFTNISAPITGRIGLRLVDAGNMVHASDPNGLAVIEQLQPISVYFTIPADSLQPVLASLKRGQHPPVDAYDRDDKNRLASGTLLTVDNAIDATTGTSRLKAQFTNADGVLFPNQFVNCRMLIGSKHNAVIVPVPAIQRGPQGTYVYVVKPNNTAAVAPVTTGVTEGNDIEIVSGLESGQQVIVDGQDKLQENGKVDLRTPGGNPAGAGRSGKGKKKQ